MNFPAIRAIYTFEMARTWRTPLQSIVSPVISTSLYFVVFGAAIGSSISEIDGVSYGAFIVPGLIMLLLLTQSVSNASFGTRFPKLLGTIYQVLSAPVSYIEIVLGYVGAAATKSCSPRMKGRETGTLGQSSAPAAGIARARSTGPSAGPSRRTQLAAAVPTRRAA